MLRNPGPVIGVAVCLAGWLAVLLAGGVFTESSGRGLNDEYDQIAINLVEHGTYSANLNQWENETVTRGPGYPFYLAGIFHVFGVANYTAVRLLDFVVHGITVCLVGVLLTRFGGPVAGWIGGLLYAFWPTTFYYVGKGSSETLLVLWTVAGFYLYLAHRERPSLGTVDDRPSRARRRERVRHTTRRWGATAPRSW
ncbi:MAG: glycosyltransferase family 39 protein, partial [Acidobacteriota bacterium]|nr:glycosyltransferase family 39 protein [Acidobacteriota bacterium]